LILLIAGVTGLLAARLGWLTLRPALSQPPFLRVNYRGRTVPTAGGLILALTVMVVEAGRVVLGAAGVGDRQSLSAARMAVVLVVVGLSLVGLADDLVVDSGRERGFRGHLRALGRGRLTTGGAKIVGGAAVAALAVSLATAPRSLGRLAVDAAVVALAANLGNLLDRAPGRAAKSAIAAFLVLAVATRASRSLSEVAVLIGGTAGLLLDDLHERVMLGDTGANALGAALGLGLVLTVSPTVRLVALAVLVLANGASEVVSFSEVIERTPPLRALDTIGRRR
jgi:UDP-N-acetylmuramyl pentapeptide phosphotransferase/UDP-N-acetylglucosamine-1-phosphate transferase